MDYPLEAFDGFRPESPFNPGEHLREDEGGAADVQLLNRTSAGVPCRIRRATWKDTATVVVAVIACALSIAAVLAKSIAMEIGQTNQLVVLGLLLAIMGLCTQRQVQKLNLLYEACLGASTLQNFEAFLRNDYFASMVTLQPRLILLFLLLLPLGLSASYKKFSGGSTERLIPAPEIYFGATAAPGYQLIGNGLSLLVVTYLPFWMNPALGRTYGFNLFIADNNTAAILDAPRPADLTYLQSSLQDDQSIVLIAEVNATVTEKRPIDRHSMDYWDAVQKSYGTTGMTYDNGPNGASEGILAGQNDLRNWTTIYLSHWNETGQTFESQAERFVTTRRTCNGTWNVTRTNVFLTDVTDLQTSERIYQNQAVFQENSLSIGTMFEQFLGEYDWATRRYWDQPLPDSSLLNPKFTPTINTRSALVATMLWARMVSLDGPERPSDDSYNLTYLKQSREIKMKKRITTLQRSPWLIVILIIHPILAILAVFAKSLLLGTPISEDFGLVSLLAAVSEDGVKELRGAALSGKLTKKMKARFIVRPSSKEDGYDRLELQLGSQERSNKIDKWTYYG